MIKNIANKYYDKTSINQIRKDCDDKIKYEEEDEEYETDLSIHEGYYYDKNDFTTQYETQQNHNKDEDRYKDVGASRQSKLYTFAVRIQAGLRATSLW